MRKSTLTLLAIMLGGVVLRVDAQISTERTNVFRSAVVLDVVWKTQTPSAGWQLKARLMEPVLKKLTPTLDVHLSRAYFENEAAWYAQEASRRDIDALTNAAVFRDLCRDILKKGEIDVPEIKETLAALKWGSITDSGKRNFDLVPIVEFQNVSLEQPQRDAALPRITVVMTEVTGQGRWSGGGPLTGMPTPLYGLDADITVHQNGQVVQRQHIPSQWPSYIMYAYSAADDTKRKVSEGILAILQKTAH